MLVRFKSKQIQILSFVFMLSIRLTKEKLVLMTDLPQGDVKETFTAHARMIYMETSPSVFDVLRRYDDVQKNDTVGVSLKNIFSFYVMKELASDDGKDVRHIEQEILQTNSDTTNPPTIHFHHINDAIHNETSMLHTFSGRKVKAIAISYQNCKTIAIQKMKNYLAQYNSDFSCTVVDNYVEFSFELRFFLTTIEYRWKVSHVVFNLPLHLLELALQEMKSDHFFGVTVITYGLSSATCKRLYHEFPHLHIYNARVSNFHTSTALINDSYWIYQYLHKELDQQRSTKLKDELHHVSSHSTSNRFHRKTPIKVATVIDPPYVILTDNALNGDKCIRGVNCRYASSKESLCCSGIAIEIFERVIDDLELTFDMYIVEDGKYGWMMPNGSWNGVVNEIKSKRAEIGVSFMFYTKKRHQVVDYTHPVLPNLYSKLIVTRPSETEYIVVNFTFLEAMEQELVIYVPLITSLVVVIVFVLENIGFLLKYNRGYNAGESFSYINAILYQRDLGAINPRRWPARVVSLVFAFSMTVFISGYTAQLTSSKIGVQPSSTFKGLKDTQFLQKSFRVGVIDSTATSLTLDQLSSKGSIAQKATYVRTEREGIERVANRTLDAFIGTSAGQIQQLIVSGNLCQQLETYFDNNYVDEVHYIVQKGSSLRSIFSESIFRLTEDGELKYIMRKWNSTKTCRDMGPRFTRFPWEYFGGLVVLISGTTLFSVMILFLEKLADRTYVRGRKTYVISEMTSSQGQIQGSATSA